MPSPQLEVAVAAEYFERNCDAFREAKNRTGTVQRFYEIGTHVVLLEFAGNALVSRLTRSLEHLRTTPTAKPSLTVSLWDSESTAVPARGAMGRGGLHRPKGDVGSYSGLYPLLF